MHLPRKIMNFLRSRRLRLAVAWSPFRYRGRSDGGFELEAEEPSWKPEGPLVWRRKTGP